MRTTEEQLVHMINQIAENNQYDGVDKAAKITSLHLEKFWARSMKNDIKEHLSRGGTGLSAASKVAITLLE